MNALIKNHAIMTNEMLKKGERREVASEQNAKALSDNINRQKHFKKLLEEKRRQEEKKKILQKRKIEKKREADLREKLEKLQRQKREEQERQGQIIQLRFRTCSCTVITHFQPDGKFTR